MLQITQKYDFRPAISKLNAITSIELRHRIIAIVSGLDEILKTTESITMSEDTQDRLENFFRYLNKRANDATQLNRWANMISIIGARTLTRVSNETVRLLPVKVIGTRMSIDEVNTRISQLLDNIALFLKAKPNGDLYEISEMYKMIETIMEDLNEVKTSRKNDFYDMVIRNLDKMNEMVDDMQRSAQSGASTETTQKVVDELQKLQYRIRMYRYRGPTYML